MIECPTCGYPLTEEEVTHELVSAVDMIERLKCCGNCRHEVLDIGGHTYCGLTKDNRIECNNLDKWEMKE